MVALDYPRISGLFGEELILGSYLSRILPLAIGLFFLKKINIKIILAFIIFIEILILISGENSFRISWSFNNSFYFIYKRF